jgi:hypothetical protein
MVLLMGCTAPQMILSAVYTGAQCLILPHQFQAYSLPLLKACGQVAHETAPGLISAPCLRPLIPSGVGLFYSINAWQPVWERMAGEGQSL